MPINALTAGVAALAINSTAFTIEIFRGGFAAVPVLPAFFIVLALSAAYVAYGALPTMRSAFYGLGPVVVGIFAVSVYRLGKPAIKEHSQIAIAVVAAGVMFYTSVDLIVTLLAAGFLGITIFNSRRTGIILLSTLITMIAGYYVADYFLLQHSALASAPLRSSPGGPRPA